MGEAILTYACMFSLNFMELSKRSNIRHKSHLHFNEEVSLSSSTLHYPTQYAAGEIKPYAVS